MDARTTAGRPRLSVSSQPTRTTLARGRGSSLIRAGSFLKACRTVGRAYLKPDAFESRLNEGPWSLFDVIVRAGSHPARGGPVRISGSAEDRNDQSSLRSRRRRDGHRLRWTVGRI